jgi:hypothetical protein
MTFEWQGLIYVQDGIIKRGAVTRASGAGKWQAFTATDSGYAPLGDYDSAEDAQAAVERACANDGTIW